MLIDCGDCGERVSDQADACPKCGWPTAAALGPFERWARDRRLLAEKPREGIFLRTMNVLTSFVLVVAGLIAVLLFLAAQK